MNPFDFITYYNAGNVDFLLTPDIDFILDMTHIFDIELENDGVDFILYSFENIDFVLDDTSLITDYVELSDTNVSYPGNVSVLCCPHILTEDECAIETEDGIKLTYE